MRDSFERTIGVTYDLPADYQVIRRRLVDDNRLGVEPATKLPPSNRAAIRDPSQQTLSMPPQIQFRQEPPLLGLCIRARSLAGQGTWRGRESAISRSVQA